MRNYTKLFLQTSIQIVSAQIVDIVEKEEGIRIIGHAQVSEIGRLLINHGMQFQILSCILVLT